MLPTSTGEKLYIPPIDFGELQRLNLKLHKGTYRQQVTPEHLQYMTGEVGWLLGLIYDQHLALKSFTFPSVKEGDIYVVPKGNNQPAPGDLMFHVTEIDGNTVWVKGNTPDMLLGNLFVGDTDSPNNLYYRVMGGSLPVPLGDVTRLPVTSFEDGVKYLSVVEEQNKILKTLHRELCDIFKDSQTEVIYATFRRALLELRDAIDCGSNAAMAQLNTLIFETYDAPKRAKEAAKYGTLDWLLRLAEGTLS
jgi:hypothetical protein